MRIKTSHSLYLNTFKNAFQIVLILKKIILFRNLIKYKSFFLLGAALFFSKILSLTKEFAIVSIVPSINDLDRFIEIISFFTIASSIIRYTLFNFYIPRFSGYKNINSIFHDILNSDKKVLFYVCIGYSIFQFLYNYIYNIEIIWGLIFSIVFCFYIFQILIEVILNSQGIIKPTTINYFLSSLFNLIIFLTLFIYYKFSLLIIYFVLYVLVQFFLFAIVIVKKNLLKKRSDSVKFKKANLKTLLLLLLVEIFGQGMGIFDRLAPIELSDSKGVISALHYSTLSISVFMGIIISFINHSFFSELVKSKYNFYRSKLYRKSTIALLIFNIIFAILGFYFLKQVLIYMNLDPVFIKKAVSYFYILTPSIFFQILIFIHFKIILSTNNLKLLLKLYSIYALSKILVLSTIFFYNYDLIIPYSTTISWVITYLFVLYDISKNKNTLLDS